MAKCMYVSVCVTAVLVCGWAKLPQRNSPKPIITYTCMYMYMYVQYLLSWHAIPLKSPCLRLTMCGCVAKQHATAVVSQL